ncbi:MAG TPA: 2-phospho-L-lactate guanylyltransferase [Streptosporangiaceae bacterium]|jgi:2-phospho-L-lactate guanylyltransferase
MVRDKPLAWSVVIPVKVLALAKTRLAGRDGGAARDQAGPPGLSPQQRAELALAMAADTVAAAVACPLVGTVLVVTDDGTAAAALGGLGALIVPDVPGRGLNAALVFGAEHAAARWPGRGQAALAGDLPALSPGELAAALSAAAGVAQAFVPDAAGTGTTLYATGPGITFWPRFGPGSRAAHQAHGAVELDLPGIGGLRQDVDTPADLALATGLGLGPRSAAVAGALGI